MVGAFLPFLFGAFVLNNTHEIISEHDMRQKNATNATAHPDKKIVVNLGMPRTGTNTWIQMMKSLYPGPGGNPAEEFLRTGNEFLHTIEDYDASDLAEILVLGRRSSRDNPLYRKLTDPPFGKIRAVADHPSFLLASIARDFPDVYWMQVTRDTEAHINSTLFMLEKWCFDRCQCDWAPKCYIGHSERKAGALARMDRLYFNRFDAIGHLCQHPGDTSKIPREVIRTWLRVHEEETSSYMQGHPRFLHTRLEDGTKVNLEKMVDFLGLNRSALDSIDFDSPSFHQVSKGQKPRIETNT